MRTLLVAAAIIMAPMVAQAEYLQNRTDWERLTPVQQGGYLMGVADQAKTYSWGEPKEMSAMRKGRDNCIVRLEMTSSILIKLVNEGYAADASHYNRAPGTILANQLSKICRDDINQQRKEDGLEPLK